ncbi:hypothetical protein [Leucobacter sp. GX24907]
MDKKKWIAYGATGLVGLGLFAGGAAAAANAMELRTTDGTVVSGGPITTDDATGSGNAALQNDRAPVADSSVTVVSAPSATSVGSPGSSASAASVQSAASAATAASAASASSAASAVSAPSAQSPASVDSPASAPSL